MNTKRLLLALLTFSLALTAYGCVALQAGKPHEVTPAPDFNVSLAGGGEATLAQFDGRPLVLNFGASWCPHCLHEIPTLKNSYDKYKGQVEFLVVFQKSPEKDVADLIEKYGLEFKVGIDPEAQSGKAYGVKGIPVTFFIDSNGNIVDDNFGGIDESSMSRKIEEMIKK